MRTVIGASYRGELKAPGGDGTVAFRSHGREML